MSDLIVVPVARPFRALFAVALMLASASCSKADSTVSESQPNGAVGVTVVDSVALADSDTAFVARPAGIAVARNGDVFISDNANKRLFHYRRNGAFIKAISRAGNGPGEVASFGSIAIADDSLLIVKNLARLRIEVFDVNSGAHRWGRCSVCPARRRQPRSPCRCRAHAVTADAGRLNPF